MLESYLEIKVFKHLTQIIVILYFPFLLKELLCLSFWDLLISVQWLSVHNAVIDFQFLWLCYCKVKVPGHPPQKNIHLNNWMQYITECSDTHCTPAVDLVPPPDREKCRYFIFIVRKEMVKEHWWSSWVSKSVSISLHFLSTGKSPMTLHKRKYERKFMIVYKYNK